MSKLERPTKTRRNGQDVINVPFADMTTIELNFSAGKPQNYTVKVKVAGEKAPVFEAESVGGKLSQPTTALVDNVTVVEQKNKKEKKAKTHHIVLDYKGTNYTITSRLEGPQYMTRVERTQNGLTESVRFGHNDQNPYVTYTKPVV